MNLQAAIDSFILTKILFFLISVANVIYWASSLLNHKNIVWKIPAWHRVTYLMGFIIVFVASWNMWLQDDFSFQHLNMFLIGAVIVLLIVAIWDKRMHKYFKDIDE